MRWVIHSHRHFTDEWKRNVLRQCRGGKLNQVLLWVIQTCSYSVISVNVKFNVSNNSSLNWKKLFLTGEILTLSHLINHKYNIRILCKHICVLRWWICNKHWDVLWALNCLGALKLFCFFSGSCSSSGSNPLQPTHYIQSLTLWPPFFVPSGLFI